MQTIKLSSLCCTILLLAACAHEPMGPTVLMLPAPDKPFEVFQAEQASCKQYAGEQIGGQVEAANTQGVVEGIGGTVLGAGLGAALGGGHGAAVGAGLGAAGGTMVGGSTSSNEQRGIQQQYNNAYIQCMVAKGNQFQQPVIYAPPPTVIYTQPMRPY